MSSSCFILVIECDRENMRLPLTPYTASEPKILVTLLSVSECREVVSRQVWDLETREFESHHSDLLVRTVVRRQASGRAYIGSSENALLNVTIVRMVLCLRKPQIVILRAIEYDGTCENVLAL